jgi:hypothetical protein
MRTLYPEGKLLNDNGEPLFLTDGESITYSALTSMNTGTGMMNPMSIPYAISLVAGETVSGITDVVQWMGRFISETTIRPDQETKDWIRNLPQYSFSHDLSNRSWDPIFNPHETEGLKSSSIATAFWMSLLGAKFAPFAAKTGMKVGKGLLNWRKKRKLKAWRNNTTDLLVSNNKLLKSLPSGYKPADARLKKLTILDPAAQAIVDLSRALATNSSDYRSKLLESAERLENGFTN